MREVTKIVRKLWDEVQPILDTAQANARSSVLPTIRYTAGGKRGAPEFLRFGGNGKTIKELGIEEEIKRLSKEIERRIDPLGPGDFFATHEVIAFVDTRKSAPDSLSSPSVLPTNPEAGPWPLSALPVTTVLRRSGGTARFVKAFDWDSAFLVPKGHAAKVLPKLAEDTADGDVRIIRLDDPLPEMSEEDFERVKAIHRAGCMGVWNPHVSHTSKMVSAHIERIVGGPPRQVHAVVAIRCGDILLCRALRLNRYGDTQEFYKPRPYLCATSLKCV